MVTKAGLPTKADSVIAAARELFLKSGYAATSVDAIADRAGVSKATLYSHFTSKEQLFADAMMALCEEVGRAHTAELDAAVPVETVLRAFARQTLEPILQPEAIAAIRAMAAEAGNFPAVGRMLFESGVRRHRAELAGYLRAKSAEGSLRVGDPDLAAGQFMGLVQGTLLIQGLLGADEPLSEADVTRHVDHAVDVFLHGTAGRFTRRVH